MNDDDDIQTVKRDTKWKIVKTVSLVVIGLMIGILGQTFFIPANDYLTTTAGMLKDKLSFNTEGVVKPKSPHILFFLVDDLGWNDVGYHDSIIHTPTIDKLANEGVKLENYYVQPICTPSRSQLLTGRHQIHTGLQHLHIDYNQANGLTLNATLLPEQLKKQNYSSYLIGKWHLGHYKKEYLPQNRGFDRFFGIYAGQGNHFTYEFTKGVYGLVEDGERYDAKGVYSTHLYTQKTMQYVEEHLHKTPEKPMFIIVSYQAVHAPLQVPESYRKRYVNATNDPNRALLAGMTACIDESIKNITKLFKKQGIWNDTVTIFSTDNGGSYDFGSRNFPLSGKKGELYEGGIRGVAFVHSPLLKKPRRMSRDLLHVSDWYPTIARLGGVNISDYQHDAFDVWDTISAGAASPRTEILHNIDPLQPRWGASLYPGIYDTGCRSAIRVGPYKLLTGFFKFPFIQQWYPPEKEINAKLNKTKNVWLYNIEEDESEHHDLFFEKPAKVMELLLRLREYNRTAVKVQYPPFINVHYKDGLIQPWLS